MNGSVWFGLFVADCVSSVSVGFVSALSSSELSGAAWVEEWQQCSKQHVSEPSSSQTAADSDRG